MDIPDPLLEAEPDFLAEQFLQARAGLAALNIPEGTITAVLRDAWIIDHQARHDAWEAGQQGQGDKPPQGTPPQTCHCRKD